MILRVLAASSAVWIACGCATVALPPPVYRVTDENARIRAFVESARAGGAERRGLRALATLRLESPDGSGSTREVILVERPSRLRLETLSPLGQTQALLVTDGALFAFFDGRGFERGRVTADLLRERFGMDLEPREAVRLFLAAPAIAFDSGGDTLVLGQGDDRILLSSAHRVRFGPQGELREVDVLDPAGAVRWSARYERWRDVGTGRYPFGVTLFFPATGVRAELELREVDLNPSLNPELFRVPAAVRD